MKINFESSRTYQKLSYKKPINYLKAHVPTNQTNMIEFLALDQKQSTLSMSVVN